MASQRPITPSGGYNGIPTPSDPTHLSRGYGANSHLGVDGNDFATTPSAPVESSPLSQSLNPHDSERLGRFNENFDAQTRGSSVIGDGEHLPARSASRASTLGHGASGAASGTPSRSGTLKKRASVKRSGSLKRSSSRRSVRAGSIKGVEFADEDGSGVKHNSVFYTPVPTSGSPTDILANRFQAWRKLLKDLISYFREVGASFEHRSKALLKVSNVINNTNAPALFLAEGGLNDANKILRDYHKQALSESNKAKEIENEVVNQLSGLRADLSQKIKEIKSLSGDFKNSVDKEKENTRKAVGALEESLALIDSDPAAVAGKGDPFVVRLGVDRQVERQIDEENYLHRAYLNLEHSGRELESIVVGEIQKAYNALASIMKREADENYSTIEKLRSGPVGMPRDLEWNQFVTNDPHFVNPNLPMRRLEDIEYPGKHHPAAAEVRAGMLERKSKYLKSYTPGW
ncbi:phosphatidylinositol 4,5-bisphosphate-binding protein [Didymosphaeria variabile]|uniref:Phosphatidylinositol 4,5-bisphosphate-binding protein n=1 Tax=Didymosphaeria variabile TaxID=1932322 RepID=A0A9W8XEN3_9PLEO|nr:phosphatidylinositol 4,5-bisphosphate-binding protein [Didymosphaeria variabile]KAJ4348497.1 phosphatidylinositol 4,5-bisphosphate-binding protein [Didymosphaeria variabile]